MNGHDYSTSDHSPWRELIEEIDEIGPTSFPPHEIIDANDRMFARITNLMIGLFDRGYFQSALHVSFETRPGIYFIERLRRLLKLEIMTDELFQQIMPAIRRRVSFISERQVETHPFKVRGALDPVKTLQINRYTTQIPFLERLVSQRPIKHFNTAENIIVVLTLIELQGDVRSLRDHPDISPYLHQRERALVDDINIKCHQALKNIIFGRLIPTVKRLKESGHILAALEKMTRVAELRIHHMGGPHNGYNALLNWRKQYKSLDLTTSGIDYKAPSRSLTTDRAYELLVLLELLVCLSKQGRIRQKTPLTGSNRNTEIPMFECRFHNGTTWDIFIQTAYPVNEHRHFQHLVGIPDMVIRDQSTGRMIICDAKQYTVSSYGGAFYKMMGYLYQFGYPHAFPLIAGGVLFVPDRLGREAGWTVWAGTGTPEHQALASLTIPADGAITRETQLDCERFIVFARNVLAKTV